jgi:hypothetical protein
VSLNPVRARLVQRAQDWRWSSTRAHLRGKDDGLTVLKPVSDRFPDFAGLLTVEPRPICSIACAPRKALAGRCVARAFSAASND